MSDRDYRDSVPDVDHRRRHQRELPRQHRYRPSRTRPRRISSAIAGPSSRGRQLKYLRTRARRESCRPQLQLVRRTLVKPANGRSAGTDQDYLQFRHRPHCPNQHPSDHLSGTVFQHAAELHVGSAPIEQWPYDHDRQLHLPSRFRLCKSGAERIAEFAPICRPPANASADGQHDRRIEHHAD